MTDVVSSEARSRMMAKIRAKNTKPEMRLRRFLHGRGFRFRLHYRHLPGSPDLVLPKYRTVIFVHGCFWHQHPGCRYATSPANNSEFWIEKFRSNSARDKKAIDKLLSNHWKVIVIWECGLRPPNAEENLAWLPGLLISGNRQFYEWPTCGDV